MEMGMFKIRGIEGKAKLTFVVEKNDDLFFVTSPDHSGLLIVQTSFDGAVSQISEALNGFEEAERLMSGAIAHE